ncbi:hypothetical protein BPAE_0021g00680 [Botrytis paeoniae]|uniref:Dickkopf N-terminal cysteine-rich domain-containing protein n=1 Tax=Botrytis paeoniae TaxID=278948 RepID=A0A4Z1G3M9_9HELO|nr:hypothetical protein BPAE_0021g00680 [Botrytis paeoniae]
MRTSNVMLAILSLSSTISALAAPRSAALDKGLNGFEKDCQCSAMGSVCHKASHINCCNGFSCEMMDNPNGDYGICRASNDGKKDDECMCSMSDDVCHPKSDINCCFGLFCDMTNSPSGDYGKCKPSHGSKNPFKKIEDAGKCLESGCAPPCCSGAKCNKVGRSDSQMFMCEKGSNDEDQDDDNKCLKPGCMVTPPTIFIDTKSSLAMHCNYLGSPKCCSGSKCNKIGKSDSNIFMCEKESDDDDKKQCLVPGAHHCNMPGMECCPGASCKNVRGESFMCAKDSDDDDDISSNLLQDQQPLFSSKDKNIFEEDYDRNMCIEGGRICHRHKQNSKCPPAPCCPDFQCAYMGSHRESFCVSMSDSNEKTELISSKKKNEVMTENCAPQEPTGCSPFGCRNPLLSSRNSRTESGMSYCMTPGDQEEEHSRLYALKGMFHGFVEKIEKKYCLPQGESCMMQHDKCCHVLMCHSGECMADNGELKL